jgi:hypothetical protein
MDRFDDRISGENGTKDRVENEKVDAFIRDIVEVCKKHGLAISHEDNQGSFEIIDFDESYINWLMDASISKNCTSA